MQELRNDIMRFAGINMNSLSNYWNAQCLNFWKDQDNGAIKELKNK